MKRIIYHIDVNSAFLSWEAVYRLYHLGGKVDLRKEVAAVGGDMAMRHGIILAKSIPAKRYHIHTGESILEAKQKCPELLLVPPNYGLYERCSTAFMNILRKYSPCVEQYSIDEAFVDMSGTEDLWGDPVELANQIRREIRDTLGFTVNIGVSDNKLLAKMASDFKKTDMVHTLWNQEIEQKMWPLPVSELFFVGRATTKKLLNIGIRTIGDLASTDPVILHKHLKKYACQLFEQLWDGTAIRHLGIHTSRLKDNIDMRQLEMFDTTDYEKLEMMDATVDTIRRRYGNDAVKRAAFVGNKIDHMSGGISREKRSVDYKKMKIE